MTRVDVDDTTEVAGELVKTLTELIADRPLADLQNLALSVSGDPSLQKSDIKLHMQSLLAFVTFILHDVSIHKSQKRTEIFFDESFEQRLEQFESVFPEHVRGLQERLAYEVRGDIPILSGSNIETSFSKTASERSSEPRPSASTASDTSDPSSITSVQIVPDRPSGFEGQHEQAEAATETIFPPQTREKIEQGAVLGVDENAKQFVDKVFAELVHKQNGNIVTGNVMEGRGIQHNCAGPTPKNGFNIVSNNKHINNGRQGDELSIQVNGHGLDINLIKRRLGITNEPTRKGPRQEH